MVRRPVNAEVWIYKFRIYANDDDGDANDDDAMNDDDDYDNRDNMQ